MRWMDLTTDNNNLYFRNKFWENFKETKIPKDSYWTDRIKIVKDNPIKRIELGLSFLPYPGAFIETCKGLRRIISIKKTEKQSYDLELAALYEIAVIHSMSVPYSNKLKIPGFNVMELIPGNLLFNLDFKYEKIGYNKINLLGKNDITKLIKLYGNPKSHTTLNDEYYGIWEYYEETLNRKIIADKNSFEKDIRQILGT